MKILDYLATTGIVFCIYGAAKIGYKAGYEVGYKKGKKSPEEKLEK